MNKKKQIRRSRALQRLQRQLEQGTKTEKGTINKKVPLTEFDKQRIVKEIGELKKWCPLDY